MTPEKVLEVIEVYRKTLQARGATPIDYPHGEVLTDLGQGLQHCLGMLDQMVSFVHEGRMDKVFRWLGFIQGCLWMHGLHTLEDLKNHNRP